MAIRPFGSRSALEVSLLDNRISIQEDHRSPRRKFRYYERFWFLIQPKRIARIAAIAKNGPVST